MGNLNVVVRGGVVAVLLAAGLVAARTALADATPAPPLEPVAAYATMPELEEPILSPDGQVVVASLRSDGQQVLIAHSIFAKEKPRALRLGKATLNWSRWVGDDYLVVSLRKMEALAGEFYPVDRLFLVRRDLTDPRPLSPSGYSGFRGDRVIHWAPDGSHLLISMSKTIYDWPEVLRVDIPSGRTDRIIREREGISWWLASATGEVDAGMGIRGDGRWRVLYRPEPGKGFRVIRGGARRARPGGDEGPDATDTPAGDSGDSGDSDETGSVVEMLPLTLDSATRKGHVLSYRDRDQLGVYEYDYGREEFTATVFVHDRFDVDDVVLRDGRLQGVTWIEERPRVQWFDPPRAGFQAELEQALPGSITAVVSESRDRNVRLVQTESPTDPGTFYVYTDASGKMAPLGRINSALAGKPLAPTRYVSYPARDGLPIPAYLTLPLGRPPQGLPLVVMPHGGPFARDAGDYDFVTQYLANRGYAVLQPNFRGSKGYGRRFEARGYGEWGKAMQDDLDDGVKWLVASGQADPARVCMVGWSYGGYAAQVASFRNPDLYRCAVSIAGISDLAALLRYDRQWMYGDNYREWQTQVQGAADAGQLAEASSLPRVADIARPLLLVHGVDDDRVPVAQSDKLARALEKAGKPFEYVRIEDGDHSLAEAGQRVQLLTALDRFLGQHNPTDVLRPTAAPLAAR